MVNYLQKIHCWMNTEKKPHNHRKMIRIVHLTTLLYHFDFVTRNASVLLEKEREKRQALQEQCAFLGQDLFKLEKEVKHLRIIVTEQKNTLLDRENSPRRSGSSSDKVIYH